MSRTSRVRWIAVKAAYGGGGIGVLGALCAGLLMGQATLARRAIRPLNTLPPAPDGLYGAQHASDDGPAPLTLALLGDSSMSGYGVHVVEETPGGLFGTGLADLTERPVRVVSAARTGALSEDLAEQVDTVLLHAPDIAVIFIGGNDVTHRVRPAVATRHLARAVRRLTRLGTQVVVGTCPDLGTIEPIRQPLRWVARRWSREMAAAQTIAVVEAGGRTVSLADVLGAEFSTRPGEMFSADRFHPSAAGYARTVRTMLPSLGAALGLGEEMVPTLEPVPGEGVRLLPDAAVEAVDMAGTEVSPASVAGRERGPWGRWVELRHRVRFFGGPALQARHDPDTSAEAEDLAPDHVGEAH